MAMAKNNIICLLSIFLTWLSQFKLVSSTTKCVPFSGKNLPFCANMKYNRTMFPNLINQRNLREVSEELHQFKPMLNVHCSEDLEFFLCSVFVPICVDIGPLPPCKSVCEKAQNDCSLLIKKFNFKWPRYLKCDRYPEQTTNTLCIGRQVTTTDDTRKGKNVSTSSYDNFLCPPKQHKKSKHYTFMGKSGCAAECKPIYFSTKEKDFARNWVLFWSIVCMLSTAFTLLTFIVDMPRFRYPERPIIFLSGCYFMIATGFLTGPISDKSIACHKDADLELLNQGTENAACTLVFMLVYFFLMSASIWWVILTLTWFLAAGLKWGHEAIEASSQYFHAAAWALPAAKTIAILAMNRVDGDVLSGICFVGGKNLKGLRGFVLAPLLVYLVVGSFFLLSGFIALIRIRKVLKTDKSMRTDKLTRLMVRIGIFSVLYSLPAIIVIACLFYEQSYRSIWDQSWIDSWVKVSKDPRCNGRVCKEVLGTERPDFAVFMIKYLMLLMVGITSGFWIWSGKTIQSWKRFYYNKILHQRVPRHQYESKDGSARTNFTTRTTI